MTPDKSSTISCIDPSRPIWVGFDLDDVIAHLREEMSRGFSNRIGTPSSWRDWKSYSFFEPHMSVETFSQMIVDDGMLERCPAEPGAKEVIADLRERGMKIVVITARAYHPRPVDMTMEWLDRQEIEIDRLMISDHKTGKVGSICQIPNMIGYVDDHIGHLDAIKGAFSQPEWAGSAYQKMHLSLVDRPWNRGREEHHRITHINEFRDTVIGLHAKALREEGTIALSHPPLSRARP